MTWRELWNFREKTHLEQTFLMILTSVACKLVKLINYLAEKIHIVNLIVEL